MKELGRLACFKCLFFRFEQGHFRFEYVPDRQSSSLSIKQLDHRGFAASGWFDISTISKTRLTLPCIRLARGKSELTNQDSAGGKNFSVQRQINKSGKVLKSSLFSHWKWNREICTKSDLQFQKPYQIVKSEKYDKFYASKLLIWRQKWTAGVRHGTSLVVRRVWSGSIIVGLF